MLKSSWLDQESFTKKKNCLVRFWEVGQTENFSAFPYKIKNKELLAYLKKKK